MDRKETIKVLREVISECGGELLMSSVSLLPVAQCGTEGSFFELKIGCVLDDDLRKCFNTVLERNKLAIKELDNLVVIYSSSDLT